MSDLLGRLAARAVGEAPVARPRLPALFEAGETAAEGWLDVVNEEVVGPSRGSRGRAARAPSVPRVPQPSELPGSARPTGGRRREASAAAAPRREQEETPQVPPLSGIVQEPLVARDAGRPGTDHGVVAPEPGASARRASPEAVLAQRAAPVVSEPTPPVETASGAASAQPAPVRVHIGRLEVQANVQEPPRPQPHREEPREPGLSLSDYLRGRRDPR